VRPINLIPAEQRRGSAARGPGARPSIAGYAVIGVLGAAVLCVLAVVMTSNQISSKQEKLAGIQTDSQSQKQVADALRPYGQFADVQRARVSQINTLAASRFNWERPLRQLSQAIPRNVWLLTVAATESPDVEVDSGGSGGDISTIRDKSPAPAFAITGCTYSQHAVARMMTRMRNLDDVTAVHLAKSARKDATDQGGGAAVTAGGQGAAASEEVQDCTGSARVTKFDILVEFGGAAGAAAAGAQAGGVPAGSAAPIADANAAAAQGTQASAAAGGTTP
jgi:Tfp pilus assembly protein PilN